MKPIAINVAVITFIFGPGIIGTALWWRTGNLEWLFAWAWTLILGLAG